VILSTSDLVRFHPQTLTPGYNSLITIHSCPVTGVAQFLLLSGRRG